jgi:hypothetical protein
VWVEPVNPDGPNGLHGYRRGGDMDLGPDGRPMYVWAPAEFGHDPMAGLTAEQRAAILPQDQLIILMHDPPWPRQTGDVATVE